MNELSLTRLSDFFASSLEAKIKCKTQIDWSTDEVSAKASRAALETLNTLVSASKSGKQLDDDIVQQVRNAVQPKLNIATYSWHMSELNLQCKYAITMHTQDVTVFALAFLADFGDVCFVFSCQASRHEVFNYTVTCAQSEDIETEDAWQYYLQHTPSANV